jgi:type VI secretion system secreted protein VgrG
MSQNATSRDVTQENRLIAIDSPLGQDVLLLTSVQGEDVVSACFTYTIEFITKASDADVRGLVGQPVTIWLDNDQTQRVPINGYIRRVMDKRITLKGFKGYRAEVVPRLWFLECTSDCRIFQNMTLPKIVETILQDYGVTSYQFRLMKSDYPEVEYCVQYRESALAFISRLLEHVGIYFYHEHKEGSHKLILTDANKLTDNLSGQPLTIAGQSRAGEIESIATETSFQPGAWALSDYDFTGPTKQMHKQAKTTLPAALPTPIERFDFPGGYADQGIGEWQADLRMQAEEAEFNRTYGEGWATSFFPGYRFELDEEGDGGEPKEYLLLEVRHHAKEHSYFDGQGGGSEYHNSFVAVAADIPFRPRRRTPKSIIHGAQTATVVSPTSDDPIYVDEYGRVKVHFHWDRRGNPYSGATSCWVRVAQNSAGAGFGGVFTPHAGQEVVVEFLEGDPDRPLITGRVHNADKMPPLTLPDDKHKTITRDHGNNKIVMNGQAGGQHLSLIAPRNLNMFAIASLAESLSSDVVGSTWTLPASLSENPNVSGYNDLTSALSTAVNGASSAAPGSFSGTSSNDPGCSYSVSESDSGTYVGGNSSSWTHGISYSWIRSGSFSVTYDFANSMVFGASDSLVTGNSVSAVIGGSESLIVGGSLGLTLAGSVAVVLGASLNASLAGNFTLNQGYQYTIVAPPDESNAAVAGGASITSVAAVAATAAAAAVPASWTLAAAGSGTVTAGTTWAVTAAAGISYTADTVGFVVTVTTGDINMAALAGDAVVSATGTATFGGAVATVLGTGGGATTISGSDVTIIGELIQLG